MCQTPKRASRKGLTRAQMSDSADTLTGEPPVPFVSLETHPRIRHGLPSHPASASDVESNHPFSCYTLSSRHNLAARSAPRGPP